MTLSGPGENQKKGREVLNAGGAPPVLERGGASKRPGGEGRKGRTFRDGLSEDGGRAAAMARMGE